MAVKKSELYSTLWEACNRLRGGMDASQYKNYVLVILFVKYLSDKAKVGGLKRIKLPDDCTFETLVSYKKNPHIGEKVNKLLERIAEANPMLNGVVNNKDADFADTDKLGTSADLVENVSGLIAVFENPDLDFRNNRAAGDDLIGDAYEFLMRHFAAESGGGKGQFYTPGEVSILMAFLIAIDLDRSETVRSIYDPTSGSASLLLRARAMAGCRTSLDGQEYDNATIGMAKMSMVIHGVTNANLQHGDTLNNPLHVHGNAIDQFDYVVANYPFSKKAWMASVTENDRYGRWGHGEGLPPPPPNGCADYAFILHIVSAIKSGTGHGVTVSPHGVLFRGNDEGEIRKWLVRKRYISGIVGLPPNLFYGTGIPGCLIVFNKQDAATSKGIFFIDAKDGFKKDGAKNRLRDMDVRRIVDVWRSREEVPHFSHFATWEEIARNDYNLNIPRYVTPRDTEVKEDITAHLHGGLPAFDVDEELAHYWDACPTLREKLFKKAGAGYYALRVKADEVSATITDDPTFGQQAQNYVTAVSSWREKLTPAFRKLAVGCDPKTVIADMGRQLFKTLGKDSPLFDPYEAYQIMMDYWAETMQDDCYLISRDGWKAEPYQPKPKKKPVYTDYVCDLLPVDVLLRECFAKEMEAIAELDAKSEGLVGEQQALVEEHEDVFDPDWFKNAASVKKRLKDKDVADRETLEAYLALADQIDDIKKRKNKLVAEVTEKMRTRYKELGEKDVKELVIERKWGVSLLQRLGEPVTRVKRQIVADVAALEERYAEPLPEIEKRLESLKGKVAKHLTAMGESVG